MLKIVNFKNFNYLCTNINTKNVAVLFQISLDNNYVNALSIVGSTIKIPDYSNYIASTEVGNTLGNIDFKYISVRKNNGATRYEMCTVAGFDALLAPPTGYSVVPEDSFYTFTDDALYEVELIAIPQYGSKTTYNNTHFVHNNGNIYKSLVNSNTASLTDISSWQLIGTTANRTGYDDISSKYRTIEFIAVTQNSYECFMDMIYTANCVNANSDCNSNFCADKTWIGAARMMMILYVLPQMILDQEFDRVSELINELTTICNCCK